MVPDQDAAALMDAQLKNAAKLMAEPDRAAASWSAAVPCRFSDWPVPIVTKSQR
jgi:hypothetical protein